jgi:hypothetical protein
MRGKEHCDEIVRLIDDVFRELDIGPQEKSGVEAKLWISQLRLSHRAGADDLNNAHTAPSCWCLHVHG